MFARTSVQSRWWRFFALACVIIAIPVLLRAGSPTEWMRSVFGAIALLGLIGYAFGFRIGPVLFWRVFSCFLVAALIICLGRQAAPLLRGVPATQLDRAHQPGVLALGTAMLAALCLALFRHSEFVRVPNSGDRKAEPLLDLSARADREARVREALAQARAEIERPMSPEMKAEAMSFGPGRQLTLRQHRTITTVLLLSTLAAQIALSILYGGVTAMLLPAIVLVISAVAATFCSAEVILKTRTGIAKSLNAMAILLALTASALLIRDPTSPMLWLARAAFLDVTSLLIGNVLVVTLSASRRSR